MKAREENGRRVRLVQGRGVVGIAVLQASGSLPGSQVEMRAGAWHPWTVTELEQLVPAWLNLPEVAATLALPITRVHSLISDRSLVSIRIGERKIRSVPADFLDDGAVVDSLKGTVVVLADSGYEDDDIIRWLFTEDESLPGRPIDALRAGRKTEIRRRAQAAAW